MRQLLLFFTLLLYNLNLNAANTSPFWGQTGHRVVGAVADDYLSSRTKRKLKKLLNHETLASSSTFADDIKSDPRYDKFKPWHYLNMPLDGTYETSTKNPKGDLVTGIRYCKRVISDKTATKEDKVFYLKMLIHLIGDLHQPMHLGLEDDRGGNDFKVQWYYKDSNMHRVWDTQMIDSYAMSYSELADNVVHLSKQDVNRIKEGTVLDWITETHRITKTIYNSAKEGENLRYKYSYEYLIIAKSQLQKAGIRLATVLNELF